MRKRVDKPAAIAGPPPINPAAPTPAAAAATAAPTAAAAAACRAAACGDYRGQGVNPGTAPDPPPAAAAPAPAAGGVLGTVAALRGPAGHTSIAATRTPSAAAASAGLAGHAGTGRHDRFCGGAHTPRGHAHWGVAGAGAKFHERNCDFQDTTSSRLSTTMAASRKKTVNALRFGRSPLWLHYLQHCC